MYAVLMMQLEFDCSMLKKNRLKHHLWKWHKTKNKSFKIDYIKHTLIYNTCIYHSRFVMFSWFISLKLKDDSLKVRCPLLQNDRYHRLVHETATTPQGLGSLITSGNLRHFRLWLVAWLTALHIPAAVRNTWLQILVVAHSVSLAYVTVSKCPSCVHL